MLATSQVRKRHRITVIRATGAPQTRSTVTAVNVLVPASLCRSPGLDCYAYRCSQRSRSPAWTCSKSASSPGLRITRIRWYRLTVTAASLPPGIAAAAAAEAAARQGRRHWRHEGDQEPGRSLAMQPLRSAVRPAWVTGCEGPPRSLLGVVLSAFKEIHVVGQQDK